MQALRASTRPSTPSSLSPSSWHWYPSPTCERLLLCVFCELADTGWHEHAAQPLCLHGYHRYFRAIGMSLSRTLQCSSCSCKGSFCKEALCLHVSSFLSGVQYMSAQSDEAQCLQLCRDAREGAGMQVYVCVGPLLLHEGSCALAVQHSRLLSVSHGCQCSCHHHQCSHLAAADVRHDR